MWLSSGHAWGLVADLAILVADLAILMADLAIYLWQIWPFGHAAAASDAAAAVCDTASSL